MGKSKGKFNQGDLVFAKVGNFPLWPGEILCKVAKSKVEKYEVLFCGSNDLHPVDVKLIVKYSEKMLNSLKQNEEFHTKPYIKGLADIEEKSKKNQAENIITSVPKKKQSIRQSRLSSFSSTSSSSLSSTPSSPSSSTNEQPKKSKFLRKVRPNFIPTSKSSSKRSRENDSTDELDEPVENERKIRKKSPSPIVLKVPSEYDSSDSGDPITYSLNLEDIQRQLAEHNVNITFKYVRKD